MYHTKCKIFKIGGKDWRNWYGEQSIVHVNYEEKCS